MKIAYNPKTGAALTTAPANNDITFDLRGLNIFVRGEKFKGTDTTYSVFKKHTSAESGGYNGLVPVPSYTTTNIRFLREDGTWSIPTSLTYTQLTNQDLNDYLDEGEWYYAGGNNSVINKPSGVDSFELYVGRNSTSYRYQKLITYDGIIWFRYYNASSWTSWVRWYTDENTDQKVLQSATTTSNFRPVILGYTNTTNPSDLSTDITQQVYTTTSIYAQPSTGSLWANKFIGKIDWSNIEGKPNSFTPSYHSHSWLQDWEDTRSEANIPNDYNGIFKVQGIKTAGNTLGLTLAQAGYYATIIGWRGWMDYTGGYAWEIASTDKNRLYVRSGDTTTWNNDWSAIAYITDTYPTSQINKLTGYTKAISAADLATTDTLNQALGKLEYKTDTTYRWYQSITEDDNDDVINKWHEIVDFIDSVKEGTDITDEFVTRKTAQVITGQKNFNTNTGATPVIISRTGGPYEAVAIRVNDSQALFEYTNDEKKNSYVFKMINTDTEENNGSGANTSQVIFTGNSSGASVIADTFIGRLNNTLTFSAGTFAEKTYNNSSAVTVNIPTHTSHLVNNSGFLTQHQSLANYVTLNTEQTITGVKTFASSFFLDRASIIQNQANTSHYSEVIKWLKGGTSQKTYDPSIGQHNIGGDGTGSICILPYPTEYEPWNGSVGLFITKDHAYIDGKELANTANGSVYFTKFSGGEITSSGNALTQANHSITIGGQTRTAGASTCNIINSLSVSTITSSAATNLTLGITVNGVASANKVIPDLYAASIHVKDVRGETRQTTYWEDNTTNFWFNYLGTPSYDWYSGITIKGWTDDYQTWELASGSTMSLNGNLYYRNGLSGTWQNWQRIMFASELPGLFTDFSNAGSQTTSISIGGTTKTLKIDADTVDGLHASDFQRTWNGYAGKTYIGWIKIIEWTLTNAYYFSPHPFILQVYRNYFSPSPESYTLAFNFGWDSANIVQLNSNSGSRIIENFRVTRTTDGLKYFVEMYVNTSYTTHSTSCYFAIGNYTSFTGSLVCGVQSETVTELCKITTSSNNIVAPGYVKSGSSDSYVLLGGGSHKAISDFMSSNINYALSDTVGGKALQAYKLYYSQTAYLADQTSIDNFLEAYTFKCALWSGPTNSMGNSFPGATNGIILSGAWSSTQYGFQLAIDDDPTYFMALRQKGLNTWSAWKRIPMGDGTGATGTWNININGNADTVDGYHAHNLVKFYLSPMSSDAPADSAKSWFINTMPSGSGAIIYNVPGSEKTIIAGKSIENYGHMLQLNYDDNYLRILRYYNGSWTSTDWEKISAGYADSAAKAQYLASNSRMDYGWNGLNYFNVNGTAGTAVKENNTPTTTWWHILRFNHANNRGFYTDLAVPFLDNSLYYKRVVKGVLANGKWVRILDELNYTTYINPANFVTSLGTNGNYVTWTKNGATNNLTVPYASYTGYLQSHDTRSVNNTPGQFSSGARFQFKQNSVDGLDNGGIYHGILHFRPYGIDSDFSGGQTHQLGFTDSGNLYMRTSTNSTIWGSWKLFVNSENYTGIVLKIGTATKGSATLPIYLNEGTPTACSSTLGVSITGNAASSTKLTSSAGNAALPIYFSDGKPVACTASSIFSNLSNDGNNISITVAGQNRTLTVNYANSAGYTTRLYANSSNLITYPGDYSLAYSRFQAGVSNIFPTVNNANGVITAHLHYGNYFAQIGLSSDGRMYYRIMMDQTLDAGVIWNKVAWTTDIPTSLPASDVYDWAKQSTKPSYSFSEITPGVATIGDGTNRLMFRINASYSSGMYHSTPGNESMVFANINPVTSWIFANTNPTANTDWTTLTPSLQIKNGRVTINKLISNGTDAPYNLDVNGSANATILYENGVRVSVSGHTHNYLPLSGGTMNQGSHVVFPGTSTDASYGGSIEFREVNYVNTTQTDWLYAPGITFHWGGRSVGKLGLRSDGDLAWRDQSIIHSGNISSQSVNYANSANKLNKWFNSRIEDLNQQFGDGALRIFNSTSSTTANKCPSDSSILHLAWDNNNGYDSQLALDAKGNNIYFRGQDGGTWSPWKTVLHNGNSSISGNTITINGSSITVSKSDHTHSYLPLTGGTLSGNLTVGQKDANRTISIAGNTSHLKMVAHTNATYIESGNKDWNGNTPLLITGYSGNKGSNLYLYFDNIYCRSGSNSYVNLDSGNWSDYITIPTLYERNLGINGTNWTFSSPYNTAIPTIYAPTSAGTSGQVLVSNGGGAPSWKTLSIKDTDISWGTTSLQGKLSIIEMAYSNVHSSNKLAFGKVEGITLEYSQNGGSSWSELTGDAWDLKKLNLISGISSSVSTGNRTTGNTANDRLRITLNAVAMGIYTWPRKLLININTNVIEQPYATVQVEYSTIGNPTSYTVYGTYNISGWSGWNSIPLTSLSTFGGASNQTRNIQNIRLTFANNNANKFLTILDIYMIGQTNWSNPSNMSKTGHLYSYNYNQDMILPASLSLGGVNNLNNKISYLAPEGYLYITANNINSNKTGGIVIKTTKNSVVSQVLLASDSDYGKVKITGDLCIGGRVSNTTALISSNAQHNMYFSVQGKALLVCDSSENSIRRGKNQADNITLGTSSCPWESLYVENDVKLKGKTNYFSIQAPNGTHSSDEIFSLPYTGGTLVTTNSPAMVKGWATYSFSYTNGTSSTYTMTFKAGGGVNIVDSPSYYEYYKGPGILIRIDNNCKNASGGTIKDSLMVWGQAGDATQSLYITKTTVQVSGSTVHYYLVYCTNTSGTALTSGSGTLNFIYF